MAQLKFEKQLWDAADTLRGNMDASEYKHVLLGLIFLKYLSDRFEDRYEELLADGEGFEEEIDAYRMKNVFYVPPSARWSSISGSALRPEIGKTIDDAMRAIEQENPQLKGVLPKNYARPELDKRRLGEVVNLFTNISLADTEDEYDVLGRTYEYCLGKFAELEMRKGGQFYTPGSVVKTLVEIIEPYDGRVYDPCCGSGGMFVQSASFIKSHQGNLRDISIYGQESNATTWKLAKMNLAIRGIDANLGKHHADTFHDDQHKTLKADYILANPPFNLKQWGAEHLEGDVRWKYGAPPAGNANFAWMQHMIWHLSATGRIGLVLANGALSSQQSNEGKIRQAIIEDDLVECIVALPDKLFFTTGIPASLWFLNRNKERPGETLFIDARDLGTMVTRALRDLGDEDIHKIAQTVRDFEAETLVEEKGFSAVATTEDIAQQDYILTPGRYVGIKEQDECDEPFDEKMTRLTTELGELFQQGHDLEAEIRKNLKAIGYEI